MRFHAHETVVTIPREIMEAVETLIRYWYKVSVYISVPCVHCIEELGLSTISAYHFPLEACQTSAVTGKRYINCFHEETSVPVVLDRLVPDLTMKDVQGSKIPFEELQLMDLIGEGGAASVYKGTPIDDVILTNYYYRIMERKISSN